jgi:hypothetical protein
MALTKNDAEPGGRDALCCGAIMRVEACARKVLQNNTGSYTNGMKLSPKQSRNREVFELYVSEFMIASPFGCS